MTKLRIGMLSFAHSHAIDYLESLAVMPNVTVVAIADEEPKRSQVHADRHGVSFFTNYQTVLDDDSIDAVIICSENANHAHLTIASAKAGKHVLCEKPLGLNEAEMEQMIKVCKENGVQLMTAFPCRFLTPVLSAKQALDRGEIGDIIAFKATNRGSFPDPDWFSDLTLAGGGAVLDHTVHVMDLMNWFTGSRVKDVYAYAATMFDPEGKRTIDDAGMVHVNFDNGVYAVLDPSWSRNPSFPTWGDVTMDIIGTKGVISIDAFNQKNSVYDREAGKTNWQFWGDDMNALMLEAFVKAIIDGTDVPVTGEDGLKSTKVALQAYRSASAGKPVAVN
ncbi:1,5-anhydro-D-fructose reductase [compost metagenome]